MTDHEKIKMPDCIEYARSFTHTVQRCTMDSRPKNATHNGHSTSGTPSYQELKGREKELGKKATAFQTENWFHIFQNS